MQKYCIVTGKQTISGNNVSHSKCHTKRRFAPNLQKKRLFNPATAKMVTVWITARGLRTLAKWKREGILYDLQGKA